MASDKDEMKNLVYISKAIIENNKDFTNIKKLQSFMNNSHSLQRRQTQEIILCSLYPLLKSISENKESYSIDEKVIIIDTIRMLLAHISINETHLFWNIYGLLLFEAYNANEHIVINLPEEYKLLIVTCMKNLWNALSPTLLQQIYIKENIQRVSQMLFVLLHYVKVEKMRKLQLEAIACTITFTKIKTIQTNNIELKERIADFFLFFFPGISCQLALTALQDEKHGHIVPMAALDGWAQFVYLLMTPYTPLDEDVYITNLIKKDEINKFNLKQSCLSNENIQTYLEESSRSLDWYRATDKKLQSQISKFSILLQHSHVNIRTKLLEISLFLLQNCTTTIPLSSARIIEVLIALISDDNEEISKNATLSLKKITEDNLFENSKSLIGSLKEGFYHWLTILPAAFNEVDEKKPCVCLNMILGYIMLFKHIGLENLLYSHTHLNHLLSMLIEITRFDAMNMSILHSNMICELEMESMDSGPWKKFVLFKESLILRKIQLICVHLGATNEANIISDSLLDYVINNTEHKIEATFLLNEFIMGVDCSNFDVILHIINTYIDDQSWSLSVDNGCDNSMAEFPALSVIRRNLVFICLLLEGIGNAATTMKSHFSPLIFKVLYITLEKAGHSNPLIRNIAINALNNISVGCGYCNISKLISTNVDYYSFHMKTNLKRTDKINKALTVFTVILRHCTCEILNYSLEIVQQLLQQLANNRKTINVQSYLNCFKTFVQTIQKWNNIGLEQFSIRSKKEKIDEMEHFEVSGINTECDFSSGTDHDSQEQLEEDLKKNKEDVVEDIFSSEEYKKPVPPIEIELTVTIMRQTLCYLASKQRENKLIVVDILKSGLIIISKWENELLPLVHEIWSPLVERFHEVNDPLIINISFQLLVVMAQLSKTFIRHRTEKDVLPILFSHLNKFAKSSFLQDKGAAFRYSQGYKFQLSTIHNMAFLLTELDVNEIFLTSSLKCVFNYLSRQQPVPLQKEALHFFQSMFKYDPSFVQNWLISIHSTVNEDFKNNIECLNRSFDTTNLSNM